LKFAGETYPIEPLAAGGVSPGLVDIVLFEQRRRRFSRQFQAPIAARGRAPVVVDNSSAFPDGPRRPPWSSPEGSTRTNRRPAPRGIIANPNCSTIQMVVAPEALARTPFRIRPRPS